MCATSDLALQRWWRKAQLGGSGSLGGGGDAAVGWAYRRRAPSRWASSEKGIEPRKIAHGRVYSHSWRERPNTDVFVGSITGNVAGGQVYQANDTTHSRQSRRRRAGDRGKQRRNKTGSRSAACGNGIQGRREAMLNRLQGKDGDRGVMPECQETHTRSMRGAVVIRPKAHWGEQEDAAALGLQPFVAAACRDRGPSCLWGSSALQGVDLVVGYKVGGHAESKVDEKGLPSPPRSSPPPPSPGYVPVCLRR